MIVVCGCGRAYTEQSWNALPLVGYQADEVETLELRNCTCGSTHSVNIESLSEVTPRKPRNRDEH